MAQHFMGGVNASGKSALAREIGRAKPEFEIIHTGTAIMERLGIAPGDADALRALPAEHKYRENESMLSELTKAFLGKSALYDSHYLNMIEGEVTPLISGTWPAYLGSLVLLETHPEILFERIKKDRPIKDRRLFPAGATPAQAIDILGDYTQQTREECERLASTFDLPVLVLRNDSERLDGAVQEFLEFDERINLKPHNDD